MKALQGYYLNAKQMRADLMDLITDKKEQAARLNKKVVNNSQNKSPGASNINVQRNYSRQDYRKKKKKSGWMETVVVVAFMFILLGLGAWYITTK
jgi:CRISPR/Cas system CSM-associated protein Csm2 small subunit